MSILPNTQKSSTLWRQKVRQSGRVGKIRRVRIVHHKNPETAIKLTLLRWAGSPHNAFSLDLLWEVAAEVGRHYDNPFHAGKLQEIVNDVLPRIEKFERTADNYQKWHVERSRRNGIKSVEVRRKKHRKRDAGILRDRDNGLSLRATGKKRGVSHTQVGRIEKRERERIMRAQVRRENEKKKMAQSHQIDEVGSSSIDWESFAGRTYARKPRGSGVAVNPSIHPDNLVEVDETSQ